MHEYTFCRYSMLIMLLPISKCLGMPYGVHVILHHQKSNDKSIKIKSINTYNICYRYIIHFYK